MRISFFATHDFAFQLLVNTPKSLRQAIYTQKIHAYRSMALNKLRDNFFMEYSSTLFNNLYHIPSYYLFLSHGEKLRFDGFFIYSLIPSNDLLSIKFVLCNLVMHLLPIFNRCLLSQSFLVGDSRLKNR